MLAGLSIYELQKKVEEQNLSAKMECFTHDSSDTDIRIKDTLSYLKLLDYACVEYIKEEFGVPMAIDIEIGVSNNKMISLDDIKIDNNKLKAGFKGTKDSLLLLKEQLERYNVSLSFEVEKEDEVKLSSEQLFLTKSAYAKDIGSSYIKVSGDLLMEF
jgi:hypothetical protein